MKNLLLAFFLSTPALACGPEPMLLDYPAGDFPSPVQVSFSLIDHSLHAFFEGKGAALKRKPKLGRGEYPYQFEVTEVFVSAEGGLPYYELELTPYGDTLQMKIDDPKHLNVPTVDLGLDTKVSRSKDGWTTEMIIPLERLGWKGDPAKVVGNAFAILGAKANRRYYVRNSLPAQKKPNFHVPEAFKPLLDCPAAN